MLTAVYLHGHLADKYGERFDLAVHSVAEAISLLRCNFATFAEDVIGHSYRIWVGKTNVGEDELVNPSNGQDIHIVPHIEGAGGIKKSNAAGFLLGPHMFPADSKVGQIVRIVVGIVLIVVGILFWEFGGLAWGVNVGINLLASGISDYITFSSLKKLNMSRTEGRNSDTSKASYRFNGAVNTVAQGNPVPILYGRAVVGSQVISAGVTNADFS